MHTAQLMHSTLYTMSYTEHRAKNVPPKWAFLYESLQNTVSHWEFFIECSVKAILKSSHKHEPLPAPSGPQQPH